MNPKCILIPFLLILLLSVPASPPALAQSADDEVFLHFRHQGVVNTFVSSIYYQDQFYLSVADVFPALGIDLEIDTGRMLVTGNFLGEGRYTIELDSRVRRARFDERDLDLSADDFIITDLGYYLHPRLLQELFQMEFIFDFGNLAVSLETPRTMPVVAQRERERRRERMLRTQRELRREFYPLQFDRNQQMFNGGFLDYNLTANLSEPGNSYLFNTSLGTELIGGDLQGTIFGSYSPTATSLRSSSLRWRYGFLDNDWISSITAGQTTAMGLVPVAYTGIRLTNEPIEPRFLYGETAFTGTVDPNSEVELYRNNTLIDFVQADGSGQYRFTVPLTYGASNYSIRVFSPTGEMTQRDARLQIPFSFVPRGEVNYVFNAGRLDNPIAGSTDRGFMSKLNVDAGLTDRITASGGMEYFEDFHESLPTFRAGVSSRLFTNYLVSFEAASEAFLRASAGVIYPNNASIDLNYTHYNVQGGIYNPSRNTSALRGNIFTPFEIGSLPLFLRLSFTNEQRSSGPLTRYRADLNTRLGRANLRLGYRDTQLGTPGFRTTSVGRLNTSVTYNISRSREIPRLMRGMFLRSQLNYIPAQSRIEDTELQVSRNVTRNGRLQVAAGRNFIGDFNLFRFTFTFDFSAIRSNTSLRSTRTSTTLTQSLRGSVGYDSGNNNTLFTNRQQVGRSGVAVRLFVDNNNSGTYDEGDELIADNAVRIDRAGGIRFMKDGIIYISQLQPYRQYNLTINKASITNPLLVPELENFSIITDPNQYKIIDVPFYMSGIVEGTIYRTADDGSRTGLGGLRLYLRQINVPEGREPYSQEIRTFSDGSFYAYEIPPGDYVIEPDPSQLRFLNAVPDVEQIEFSVQALAEGDIVEGLSMNITPEDVQPPPDDIPVIVASYLNGDDNIYFREGFGTCRYTVYFGSYGTLSDAFSVADLVEGQNGVVVDVMYNSVLELYSVRASERLTRNNVSALIRDSGEISGLPIGVIESCENDRSEELNNRYHIRLGSFETAAQAESAIGDFRDFPDLRIRTRPAVEGDQTKLLAGPFRTTTDVSRALLSLIFVDDPSTVVRLHRPEPEEEFVEYEYILSLGEFTDPDQALEFVTGLEEQTGINLTIVQIDDDRYQVITGDRSADLEEITELGERIRDLTGITPPVARITPAVPDTEAGRPVRDTERVLREIPEIPPIVVIDDTLAIPREVFTFDTTRIQAIEILEEEELRQAAPPLPPLDADRTVDPVVPGRSLADCEYPVQVGSFGGHILAREVAGDISERIGTSLLLFYNEHTSLFALRTAPEPALSEAYERMASFRRADSFNQYAIVVQCAGDDEFRRHRELQFVVPLIRYNREDQAQHYSESIRERHGIETVIRTDQNQIYYSVFAGPVSLYEEAVELRNLINQYDIVSDPVIVIDPYTRNRFRAHFQIYLGMYTDESELRNAAIRYREATGRAVSVRMGNDGSYHVFDETIYGAWSEFLQNLSSLAEQAGLDVSEILIFD